MDRMNQVIQSRGMIDLGASGPKYTWTNKRQDGELVMKRLDRAFANARWRVQFPEVIVRVLPRTHGDHSPLLLDLEGLPPPPKKKRPFRFNAAWMLHSDFRGLVSETWTSEDDLDVLIERFAESVKK